MAQLQRENSFVVELTPEGVQEIQRHKNIYTEDTAPIPLSGREWSTKNFITLWTGILVSIPVYMMASALLSAGLTWYQALFICVLGHTLVLIPSILLAYELFGGAGLELIALGCGVCYMLSGTHGLYSSQLFVTEKLLSEYTASWGERLKK